MQRAKTSSFGWQGAGLVAITYVYFLIFAQFAFLKRLAILGVADAHLKAVMAAMAAGGILLSLLTPRLDLWPSANLRLRIGLAVSGIAAFLALLPLGFRHGDGGFVPDRSGARAADRHAGHASARMDRRSRTRCSRLVWEQASAIWSATFRRSLRPRLRCRRSSAGILCLAGIGITFRANCCIGGRTNARTRSRPAISFYRVLAGFTALVWLDSAAFFIIQNTPALKAGTWQGTIHLWANGLLHLGAALVSAWLLRRKGLSPVLTAAFIALGDCLSASARS